MSTPFAEQAPCWYLHPMDEDAEWIPHYSTEAEARADLDPDDEVTPRQCSGRCIRLTCDTCDLSLGMEEMTDVGMHIDPDNLGEWLSQHWTDLGDDRHRCSDCPIPDDEPRDLSRVPTPDDVPLPMETKTDA